MHETSIWFADRGVVILESWELTQGDVDDEYPRQQQERARNDEEDGEAKRVIAKPKQSLRPEHSRTGNQDDAEDEERPSEALAMTPRVIRRDQFFRVGSRTPRGLNWSFPHVDTVRPEIEHR